MFETRRVSEFSKLSVALVIKGKKRLKVPYGKGDMLSGAASLRPTLYKSMTENWRQCDHKINCAAIDGSARFSN